MVRIAILCLSTALATPALSASLVVTVSGVGSAEGEVGCALYAGEEGFLSDGAASAATWVKADPAGVTCRFDALRPGVYAVAVSHDVNGNRKTDTNVLGIPKEPWGVTNDARPRIGAPSFRDAAVRVDGEGVNTVSVTLDD
ncbi:DUF2141 domain-containing protein [Chthonobacter rhizosphaerae]|uniref:DUF2141 domain-containing protein n=1 Tax=Chthonobacter rhizosphaerae TaxID=2735553 RepID=UPI0015EF733D|nr:DUF2141 domain-containing protein [Chthonobacter rhizosphaerae]